MDSKSRDSIVRLTLSLSGYKHNRYPLAKMSSYPAYGQATKVNFSLPSSSTCGDLGRHNSQVRIRESVSQSSLDNSETLNYKENWKASTISYLYDFRLDHKNENYNLRVKIDEIKCKIEEPAKSFENAVSENHRLKCENKALIRVLSALSKND
uniref:Uncharacterized protein n=1 Tax=Romanomermis culicivorax TaxID=13658 RepID=A0A915ILI1_ROMCU